MCPPVDPFIGKQEQQQAHSKITPRRASIIDCFASNFNLINKVWSVMAVVLNNISPPIVHHSISPHMMHQRNDIFAVTNNVKLLSRT